MPAGLPNVTLSGAICKMHDRSSRRPRDAGREFQENPPTSGSRRHPVSTTEIPRNRMQLIPTARRTLTAVSTLAFTMAACQDGTAPDPNPATRLPTSSVTPSLAKNTIADEYIVVFNEGVDDVDGRAKGLANAHGGNVNATYRTALKGFSAHMSAQAAEAVAKNPDVAYVEQNQQFELAGTQTGVAWGLDRIDQASLPLDGSFTYPT